MRLKGKLPKGLLLVPGSAKVQTYMLSLKAHAWCIFENSPSLQWVQGFIENCNSYYAISHRRIT